MGEGLHQTNRGSLFDGIGPAPTSQAAAEGQDRWHILGLNQGRADHRSTDQMAGVILLPWAGSTQAMRLSKRSHDLPVQA